VNCKTNVAIIEENYKEVTLENNTRQISSINIDALMNLVHSTSHYADMTADTAFISSEILLSLRFCKSVERVLNILLFTSDTGFDNATEEDPKEFNNTLITYKENAVRYLDTKIQNTLRYLATKKIKKIIDTNTQYIT
jgi:hypothetical protein